ncbi:Sir2 histone deacetylase Hst2 [Thecaphora frezii]
MPPPPASTNPFFPYGGGPTLEGIAKLIEHPDTTNVIFLVGAGVSTSATPPIPDFRTKSTGLYDNLAKYNLPYPEAIFDIGYFQQKPQAFFTLAKELYPGNFKPSLTHYFFKLLNERCKLATVFTQNVDTLERIAGLPAERIVEAHGSFASAACIQCRTPVEPQWMRTKVMAGEIARCESKACRKKGRPGLVKPDIVFFGEGLPDRFFQRIKDLRSADLLIVVGTSLQVQPFASLISAVPRTCPRLLINLERVGELAAYDASDYDRGMGGRINESGFDFDGLTYGGRHRTRDVYWQGKADDGVLLLAEKLGWKEELVRMRDEGFQCLDREWMSVDGEKDKGENESQTQQAIAKARRVARDLAQRDGDQASEGEVKPDAEAKAKTDTRTEMRKEAEASAIQHDSQPHVGSGAEDAKTEDLVSALERTQLNDGGGTTSGEEKERDAARSKV